MTRGILEPQNKKKVYFENGKTVDIQSVIFQVNKKDIWKQTESFSKQFSKDTDGLRDLWHFVKEQITYQEDPIGFQYIQHPAALWKSKVGDCKSFTLFIVSVLQNLGIPYIIRFTSYRKGDVTHVYPIAILNGERVILDAVWDSFDDEKDYYRKEDYKFEKNMSQIVEISGIGAARSVSETVAAYHAATKDIPNSILENDITEMSQAEFYRWLGYSVPVSGIGALETTRAFRPPVLEFDSVGDLVGISFESAKRAANKVKDAIVNAAKKAADALKEGWKKLVNWVFKTALPAASPFFLYAFLKKNLGTKVEAKKAKQESVIHWISMVSGTDKTQIEAAIRAEITKKMGKQPEMVLNEMAKSTVSGHRLGSLNLILGAVTMVVELIERVASLFKKPKPDVSANDAGSETEIADAARKSDDGANPGGSKPSNIIVPPPTNPANEEETDDTPAPDGRTSLPAKPVPTGGNAPSKGGDSMMMYAAVAVALYLITQN
jgi:Transglutaminase-like superfamily